MFYGVYVTLVAYDRFITDLYVTKVTVVSSFTEPPAQILLPFSVYSRRAVFFYFYFFWSSYDRIWFSGPDNQEILKTSIFQSGPSVCFILPFLRGVRVN
jgi:hypothetical protein